MKRVLPPGMRGRPHGVKDEGLLTTSYVPEGGSYRVRMTCKDNGVAGVYSPGASDKDAYSNPVSRAQRCSHRGHRPAPDVHRTEGTRPGLGAQGLGGGTSGLQPRSPGDVHWALWAMRPESQPNPGPTRPESQPNPGPTCPGTPRQLL